MWEILTQRKLWAGHTNTHELWRAVCAGDRPEAQHEEVEAAPDDYVALMREMWDQDVAARPTFPQAVDRLDAMRHKAMASSAPGDKAQRSRSGSTASDSSSLSKPPSGVPASYSDIVASFSQKNKGARKHDRAIGEHSFADINDTHPTDADRVHAIRMTQHRDIYTRVARGVVDRRTGRHCACLAVDCQRDGIAHEWSQTFLPARSVSRGSRASKDSSVDNRHPDRDGIGKPCCLPAPRTLADASGWLFESPPRVLPRPTARVPLYRYRGTRAERKF